MTVQGNLAFQSGALYLVYVSPAAANFTNVTGTATLNGLVGASFATGTYVVKQYTILSGDRWRTAPCSGINALGIPAGFMTNLSYDATHGLPEPVAELRHPEAMVNGNHDEAGRRLTRADAVSSTSTGGIPMMATDALTCTAGLSQRLGREQHTRLAADHLPGHGPVHGPLLTDPFLNRAWCGSGAGCVGLCG